MPDEGNSEQTVDLATEQTTDAVVEQTLVAASADGEDAVAAEGEAAPEPVVTFSSDTDVRAFLESDDRAKSYIENLRNGSFEAGRQNKDAEVRKMAVSDEVLGERLRLLALETGWDADDDRLKKAVAAFHAPTYERGYVELAKKHIAEASSTFSPDARKALEMAVEQAGGDVEALSSVVTQLWDYRASTSREDTIANLSYDQLPEGSKLHTEYQERLAREVEAELKARDTAANRIDPGPRTTNGSASTGSAPSSLEDYEKLIASDEPKTESDWATYERLRVSAGLR